MVESCEAVAERHSELSGVDQQQLKIPQKDGGKSHLGESPTGVTVSVVAVCGGFRALFIK